MPDQVRHDVDAWDRAKARFGQADAELTALAGGPDDNPYNRAGTRHDRALVRLLRTPAPDAAALVDKIDLLIAHQAWEFRAADACLAALSADAHRLAAPCSPLSPNSPREHALLYHGKVDRERA